MERPSRSRLVSCRTQLLRAACPLFAAALLTGSHAAQAANLSWDPTGTNPTAPAGGTGTWNRTSAFWSNGTTDRNWTDLAGTTDTADFAGTAGTVTLGANLGALGLSFDTAGYTLATNANTLNLGASGINASSSQTGTTTISGTDGLNLVAAQTWTVSSGNTLSVSAPVANGGNLLTVSSAGTTTLSGVISGTGGLTKSGTNVLTLTGANTYTGTTTVNAGELYADSTRNLPLSTSAVKVNTGGNVTVGDHAGTVPSMTNAFTLNGAGTSIASNATNGTVAAGALGFFNSGGFRLSGSIALDSTSVIYSNPVIQTGALTFEGVISGAGGLVLAGGSSSTGTPNFALTNNNTYGSTNATTQFSNSGTTQMTVTLLTVNNVLPTNTVLTLGGTPTGQGGTYNGPVTVALTGINQTVAGLTSSGTGTYRIVGNSATLSTFTVNNPTDFAFGGILGGTGTNNNNLALAKTGAGTLTLSAANTYTGSTMISGGTLAISGSINGSLSISLVDGGVLTLEDTAAAVIADNAILSMVSGTTLDLNAVAGTSETIGQLILDGTGVAPGKYTAAQLAAIDPSINFISSNGETLTVTAVPEPSTWALLGLGAVGAGGAALRRRQAVKG